MSSVIHKAFCLMVIYVTPVYAVDYAARFDGEIQEIVIPHVPELNLMPDSAFTIEMSVLFYNLDFINHLLGKRIGCFDAANYQIAWDANYLIHFWSASSVGLISTGFTPALNEWNHLALTFDGNNLSIFINGTLNSTNSYSIGSPNSEPLKIGASGACGNPHNGLIDEVRIWNVARSADSIAYYKDKSVCPGTLGLVAYWNFNEDSLDQNVYDLAGDPSNGTLGANIDVSSDDPIRVSSAAVFQSECSPTSCCIGKRGDVNNDLQDADILDLNFLVNKIFRGGPKPVCSEEADVNSNGVSADIVDLNFLVNRIFRSGPPPGPCA